MFSSSRGLTRARSLSYGRERNERVPVDVARSHASVSQSLAMPAVQLMASQGTESVGEFIRNRSRPKVSLREFNAVLPMEEFEKPSISIKFAQCLYSVRKRTGEVAGKTCAGKEWHSQSHALAHS